MSELDDLRSQNKELKRLLQNALELLEKSKAALSKQALSRTSAPKKKAGVRKKATRAGVKAKK